VAAASADGVVLSSTQSSDKLSCGSAADYLQDKNYSFKLPLALANGKGR
jgi:hypothetical protein